MPKPYSIFKRSNGVFYCNILLPDGTMSNNKSTGKYTRKEAEQVAVKWYAEGSVPTRSNGKENKEKSLDFITVLKTIKTFDFTEDNVAEIVKVLKERGFLQTAIMTKSVKAVPIKDFLEEFWDMENSPYIKEKRNRGQEIHAHYVANNLSYIHKYWIPRLEGKCVGEITRDDVNAIFDDEVVSQYAAKTINAIIQAITLPLKYAYFHNMTENNCYDGIIKSAKKGKPRVILSLENTLALFRAEWENDQAKLACLLACYTGMRRGEVAALQLQDIGEDRIFIRHSWDRYEQLKCTKTNEEREMPIPPLLRDMLLMQAELNPYNEGDEGYVFFGLCPSQPTDPKNWLKYMRRALETIGYKNPDEIGLHSFRHEWCTQALTEIGDKRVCMIGSGHKTDSVFANYSNHVQKEEALKKIAAAAEKVFMPMVEATEKVEYEVLDE